MSQEAQATMSLGRYSPFRLWDKIPLYLKLGIFVAAGWYFDFGWVSLVWFSISFLRLLFAKGGFQTVRNTYSKITPLIMLKNFGIQIVVGLTSYALIQIKPLAWSWTMLLHTDSQNLTFAGFDIRGWGLLYAAIVILALPLLAEGEEKIFRSTPLQPEVELAMIRQGYITWLPRRDVRLEIEGADWFYMLYWKWSLAGWVIRSITFGLIHVFIGVPIGVGLALSIGGLWLSRQYIIGGLERSTVYHTAYNLNVALLLILVIQVVPMFVG
jgi:hypothetical protein